MTSFATELATPSITDVRYVCTNTLPRLIYKDSLGGNNVPSCGYIRATWRIQLNLCFLWRTPVQNPEHKSIGSAVLHRSRQKVPIHYNGRPFPQKLPILIGGIWTPSSSWFPGPIRTHNANGITIGSAALHRWPQSVHILYNGTPL